MQLEDEVQSLQSITTQQQARLGALQQENALLSELSHSFSLPVDCSWGCQRASQVPTDWRHKLFI